MGKRIIPRARGHGGPRYRAPSHRYLGRVEYVASGKGHVVDIVHDPGRNAPVAVIKLQDGKKILHIASEGLQTGDVVSFDGEAAVGSVLPLSKISEGTKVYGIENRPGSGPKMCRSSGSFAFIVGKTENSVKVQFPSGKIVELNLNCRAAIGIPAAGGRIEKPWVKAGKHFYAMQARNKLYPRSKGVAMSPVDHPYGGKSKRPRVSKAISRHAPPGQKVGSISPRRTGRRKGR